MNDEIAILADDGLIAEAVFELLEDALLGERIALLYDAEEASLSGLAKRRANAGVHSVTDYDLQRAKVLLLCVDGAAKELSALADRALQAQCQVLDIGGNLLTHPDCRLCVPSGLHEIKAALGKAAVWCLPSPSVVQAHRVLKPLLPRMTLSQIHIQSLQPVSMGYGRAGVSALAAQTAELLNARAVEEKVFGTQMAFNLLADPCEVSASSDDFAAAHLESVLGRDAPSVHYTRVHVPVFYGLTQIMTVFTAGSEECDKAEIFEQLRLDSGLRVSSDTVPEQPLSPLSSVAEEPGVDVHGIQTLKAPSSGFRLISTSDNVRTEQAHASLELLGFLIKSQA